MNKGIAIAGNLIVDYIKEVESWPDCGMLLPIKRMEFATGGCVNNTIMDVARLGGVPCKAVGYVGKDQFGDFVLDTLKKEGVDTSHIEKRDGMTSFTDVFSIPGGQRTFFVGKGVDNDFVEIADEAMDCDILHIGYALLLNGMDGEDPEYGTVMARNLARAQKKGIKTSIDVVSEAGDRFKKIVTPSLRYCNYCIINETEASAVAGIPARDANGGIIEENIKKILQHLLDCGVSELACIHAPERGWALTKDGGFYSQPSLKLPGDYIVGTTGAGDAFCAGMLFSLYKGYDLDKALKLASASAGLNLASASATAGAGSEAQAWALYEKYGVK